MKNDKKPYNKNSPEAKALIDEIVHGTFVREGTMVAFPTCFPGASTPIPADESHITALDVDASGTVYGGASGRLAHLFVGIFHGVTGAVIDLGTVPGADHCAAICCGSKKFVACVNGPAGGRIVTQNLQALPFSLIQEWSFALTPFQDLGVVATGERIVHAVRNHTRTHVVGVTTRHVFVVNMEAGTIRTVGEIKGASRLTVDLTGGVMGIDDGAVLWRYDLAADKLERNAVKLPDKGLWSSTTLRWARDPRNNALYAADEKGQLFSLTDQHRFEGPVGQTPLAPVGPMAVTFDGRLFGTCGREISRLFCYSPSLGEMRDLGAVVSVIERRRYGYIFGDAVVGRDGQIIFGEDDDLGHVWLYFPRIEPSGRLG